MINYRICRSFVFGVLISGAASAPALSHHSFAANFLMNEEISIVATVKTVRVANPHSVIFVEVADESGAIVDWTLELGTPTMLRRAGWNGDTLPAGTVITAIGSPTRSGAPTLALARILFEDGRELIAPRR